MSIRTIKYDVSANSISPSSVQRCGVQGDHNATMLQFTLDTKLKKALEEYSDQKLQYRFDGYDGAGTMVSYGPYDLDLSDDSESVQLDFPLNSQLTCGGGRVTVYLVITASDVEGEKEKTAMELYSFPAIIDLNQKPNASRAEQSVRESLTTLVVQAERHKEDAKNYAGDAKGYAGDAKDFATNAETSATNASESATAAAEKAREAADSAEAAKEALQGHNESLEAHADIQEILKKYVDAKIETLLKKLENIGVGGLKELTAEIIDNTLVLTTNETSKAEINNGTLIFTSPTVKTMLENNAIIIS